MILHTGTFTLNSQYLKRCVRVRVGYPVPINEKEGTYPVLYIHDGQNVFYDAEAYDQVSWNIEAAVEKGKNPMIVVAVDNGGSEARLNDYSPFVFEIDAFSDGRKPGGNADNYLNFLIKELKPVIDNKYETNTTAENTAIMGSSMGGVFSVYACLMRPDVFGRAASLSGAFFVSKTPWMRLIEQSDWSFVKKLYMDTGDAEGGGPATDADYAVVNRELAKRIGSKMPTSRYLFREIKGATHHERSWRERLEEVLRILWK